MKRGTLATFHLQKHLVPAGCLSLQWPHQITHKPPSETAEDCTHQVSTQPAGHGGLMGSIRDKGIFHI